MRKLAIIILSILFYISMTGCSSRQGHIDSDMPTSSNSLISSNIPTNISVNVAWGGGMCEAEGCVYYVSSQSSENQNPQAEIVRMNQDGSNPTVVTEKYDYISNLTADSSNLYFVGSGDTLFCLPLNGGTEQKVTEGNFRNLQCVKGRLYWEDFQPGGANQIVSIKTDGSDSKILLAASASLVSEGPFRFIATEDGIYYSTAIYSEHHSDLFHMDLSGENTVKLNRDALNRVNCLFYDRDTLYLLMDNDLAADSFSSSIVTLDQDGKMKTILKHTGYFEQDFCMIQYCGISNGIIYYFLHQYSNGTSAGILLDLHQYDIDKDKDELILREVEMGNPAVGTIYSLRGKSMKGASFGMYILGNDIYYETILMP